ncbi:ATP-grasp domain-containing protein [Streptomyces sp. NBC_00306]|uniref:ATP-grasp domain-containing protein n=1 Tax=Streptomyces sp. NBC_00306 TaxID=2975708 RepID=UPI002E29529A|nr:ATP-grasp domain-containing protein [Streptomyces sp. NBC_00306]
MPLLLAPHPLTSTATLLTHAARHRGIEVVASAQGHEERDVHWYGGPLAADRIVRPFRVGLLEPADDWLTTLAPELTQRRIELTTLDRARELDGPLFVKPPSDKSVPAAVYATGRDLPLSGERIGPQTPVLVSDVVEFAAEYRLFVLDGQVLTGSRYTVFGRLDPAPLTPDAERFGQEVLEACAPTLPSAVVLDVGQLVGGRWAVVEANMAWFAQSYAAETDRVLDVVLRSSGPRRLVTARDAPFLR